jgi:hypothetical protein
VAADLAADGRGLTPIRTKKLEMEKQPEGLLEYLPL